MGNKSFLILTFFIFGIKIIGLTQNNTYPTKTVEKATCSWKITIYDKNITKYTCQPSEYTTNENISDAVILKPKQAYSADRSKSGIIAPDRKVQNPPAYTGKKDGYEWIEIKLKPKEKIYGGGERALPLNRRGYVFNLENNPWYGYVNGADNLNFSVPFFTSSEGYGLFFDNPSIGTVDIGKSESGIFKIGFKSGELNVYFIKGNTPKEILNNYCKLTGTQGLPPRWAMGNFMSRFGYTSEFQVKEIASKMRDEKMPFDAIIYDLFWFGDSIKGTLGNLEWRNRLKWPDPKGMISSFKKQNIKTILITEPFILKSTTNYTQSSPYHAVNSLGKPFELTNFYFGMGGLIDIFRKDAQQWFWAKHDAQNKIGVDGWWGDLGEPEKHPLDVFHNLRDLSHSRLFRSDEVHNLYGHYWTKMLFENYAILYPDVRLFSLNRSGFAGSQRYNIIPWSGDVSRNWSGFQAQPLIMLGMSMSGIPYIHADAGGFAGGEGDYELYVRWLQFAAFTPIFRPHGTALYEIDPQAYSFPSEPALIPEPYKSMVREIIHLRYKLLPYNYTMTYRQAMFGDPLVAPLYYSFPSDKTTENIEDQYMWGENIMVAPIFQKNRTERIVILPKGVWYRLDSNFNCLKGVSGEQNENVDLENLLLYVKAGSFIPIINKEGNTTEDYTTDSLTIHYYYAAKKSNYTLFDDNGLNKNSLKNKEFELISFLASSTTKDNLKINISSNRGTFPEKKSYRVFTFVIHECPVPKKIKIDGKIIPFKTDLNASVIFSVKMTPNKKSITIKLN